MRLRSTEISTRTIGDETIVLSLSSSRYFSITGVGSRVFQLLAEERSIDQLVDTIVGEYDVDPARARTDVTDFVDRLRAADLLN
ncbi:MAG: PqqD family protein [Thermocrispum sp.]